MTEHIESPQPGGHGPQGDVVGSPDVRPASPVVSPSATRDSRKVETAFHEWAEPPAAKAVPPAVHWRELLSVLLLVVLADITIYRGTGFAGAAVFLAIAPVLLLLGSPASALSLLLGGLAIMIGLTAARLVWQGSIATGLAGLMVLLAFAMTLARRTPFVLELLGFSLKAWFDSVEAIGAYDKWFRRHFGHFPRIFSLQWILPLIAVVVFGVIFVAANPDHAKSVQRWIWEFLTDFGRWLEAFSSSPLEVLFCMAVGWYVVGVLRPIDWNRDPNDGLQNPGDVWATPQKSQDESAASQPPPNSNFAAFRNTLIAVSVLFAAYLVFEFQTLWFRQFPKGFHYSGYAHEGAAWLTVALGLATIVLSLIFRGKLLQDSRLPQLRTWAWIWSVENFVLALAVYNRVWIYIGFNGMTRMRVVALFGISSVVVGFLLVLWKIAHSRGFLWLIRRHLLTVTLAAYLYLIIPVDWLVYSYNVRRILAGDPAPSVQITEHYVSPEGILTLPPLLQSSDPFIREGIESLLAERAAAESNSPNQRPGWTGYQLVHDVLARRLKQLGLPQPSESSPTPQLSQKRATAWDRFRQYAYQWY